MNSRVDIRRAHLSECDKLYALQRASLRELGRACYDEAVIEAFITHVGTMDPALISDGTFYSAYYGRVLVGCGGWTFRTPSYSAHMADTGTPAMSKVATIRSIYVHPMWSRRGIAARIMAEIEQDIVSVGHDTAVLASTLTAIPFYRQLGWQGHEPAVLKLPGDLTMMALHMDKRLAEQRVTLAQAA